MQQFPSTNLVQKYVITAEAVERKRKKRGSPRTLPDELIADILNAFIRADGDFGMARDILGISIRSKENIRMLDAIGHWGPKLLPTPLRKLIRDRRIGHHKKPKIRKVRRGPLALRVTALPETAFPESTPSPEPTAFLPLEVSELSDRLLELEVQELSHRLLTLETVVFKEKRDAKPFILKRVLKGIGRRLRFLITGR